MSSDPAAQPTAEDRAEQAEDALHAISITEPKGTRR